MYGSRKGALSGSASSILERAKGQLQGKRYGAMTRSAGSLNRSRPNEDTEEDDLNAYLSQISKKTSGKVTTKVDKDDEVSDISISSEEDFGVTNSTLNASRFLKKSQSQTLTTETAKEAGKSGAPNPIRKSATTPNFLNKTAPAFTSSALQKATQLGAKFAKKKAAIAKRLDSDSDDELQLNKDVFAGDRYSKERTKQDSNVGDGNKFLKKTPKKTFYVSESDDSSIKTDPEDNFGRDGNRFLKKSSQPHQDITDPPKKEFAIASSDASSDASVDAVPASRFLKKKTAGAVAANGFSTSTPKKELYQTQKAKQNERLSRTAPVASSSHLGMSLDSDEEDLKDFIDNLTPTSTPEVPPVREVDEYQQKDQTRNEDNKKSAYKRTLTPGPGKRVPSVTSSESSHDSVDEDIGSSVAESIDEDVGGLAANIMRIEDLEPAGSLQQIKHQQDPKTKLKKTTTKEAWSESDVEKSETIPSGRDDDNDHQTLNLAGLQTIDDLLLNHQSDQSSEDRHDGYGSDFETATEIATQRTEEVPEESIHSDIQSSRKAKAEDSYSSVQSVSKSISESSARTNSDSYTSYTKSDSHSKSSRSYSRSRRSGTRSGKRSTSEQTQTYSEDFQSSTHDGTDTELEDLPSDDKDSTTTVTQSRSYTSYSETTTVVTPKKKREGKPRREGMRDVAIQADGTAGLLHHWITDNDIAGIGSVTQKDPTPVTTHIINPEALEALTNFSPSLLALNDSLLAQLQHARASVQSSLRLHRSLVDSIENDYEYTTLENTKEFIAQHRRPKLTMEQAMLMVKQEMDEEDRL